MKKSILITIVFFFIIVSCSSPISPIEHYVKTHMNNPDAYKSLGITVVDTLYYISTIDEKIIEIKEMINSYSSIEPMMIQILHAKMFEMTIDEYKESNEQSKNELKNKLILYQSKRDSVLSLNTNPIISFLYINDCRVQNRYGAIILQRILVYCDVNLNVYYMCDFNDSGKRLADPGGSFL